MMNQEERVLVMMLNLKHTMLRSNLCDYADAYILFNEG